MAKIAEYLGTVNYLDKSFIGTVAFRNEEITLPDGSKMALGIDDGHWVLVYQKEVGTTFQVFEYDQRGKNILVDKKSGTGEDIKLFKKLIGYLFSHGNVDDLVTLLPPQVMEKE